MPKRDPMSALPAEIWSIILRYSISAPEFLDPDDGADRFPPWLIKNRRFMGLESYRKAERTRIALQRVCKSWHEVLRPYTHRFVRMCDVAHGMVPVYYLQSAIRISFGDHGLSCCDDCRPEQFLSGSPYQTQPGLSYIELCESIIDPRTSFGAKIFDCESAMWLILRRVPLSVLFPNLESVYGLYGGISTSKVVEMIETLPLLCHLHIGLDWFDDRPLSLSSSTLTNLHLRFMITNPSFTVFTDLGMRLPALRHLHIEYSEYELDEYDEPAWVPLLKVVGKQLKTLFLQKEDFCTKEDVLKDIWTLCPKLEELSAIDEVFIAYRTTPPPREHPIHTLGLNWHQISYQGTLELPDWPGLRTIRIHERWNNWLGRKCGPLTSAQLELLNLRQITLEDSVGESYTEYFTRIESERVPL
jgi:hypothetical protein